MTSSEGSLLGKGNNDLDEDEDLLMINKNTSNLIHKKRLSEQYGDQGVYGMIEQMNSPQVFNYDFSKENQQDKTHELVEL